MKLFTDEERVKSLNKIIKEIAKCSDWGLLDLMNYLKIKNEVNTDKLPLVKRGE